MIQRELLKTTPLRFWLDAILSKVADERVGVGGVKTNASVICPLPALTLKRTDDTGSAASNKLKNILFLAPQIAESGPILLHFPL